MYYVSILVVLFICIYLLVAVKVTRQYGRAVIFRLGRLKEVKGPGLFIIIPLVDQIVRVDLRICQLDVPRQTLITSDNISVDVDAVIYYHVTDPVRAIVEVEDYQGATALIAQTMLRDVLGQSELDSILTDRETLNQQIQNALEVVTLPWGIRVDIVTIRDISLPENMLRAIARQAEAERERRARIILATGEFQAAQKMQEAALLYEQTPVSLKLREFQNLSEIAKERNLIVVTTGMENPGTTLALAKALNR